MESPNMSSIGIEKAEAATVANSGDCTDNGYKNWDDPDSDMNGKGCWCWDRSNVSNPCDDDDTGEN